MDKSSKRDQALEQEKDALLFELFEELKKHLVKLERRFAKMESTLEGLNQSVKKLDPSQPVETTHDTIDKFITEHIQERLSQEEEDGVDIEGVNSNWNYFVAQKGGYDEVLYMTVQDFFNLESDPERFLAFLIGKRDEEVRESLLHLQTEYGKLEGNQLQKHFTELWELHHNLLKKKVLRTWKEEIFLEAFEAFLAWVQK